MVKFISLISVTGFSIDQHPRRYLFFPVDAAWQQRIAALFGDAKPTGNFYGETISALEMNHRHPQKTKNEKGACLPRTLSLAIFSNERHHQKLRNAVVDWILEAPLPSETLPRDEHFYKRMQEMRHRTTWMQTEQVEAFAYLLDTPIYTCVQHKSSGGCQSDEYFWQQIPHPTKLATSVGFMY